MAPSRRADTTAALAGASVSALVTALLLWPAFGRGVLLYRDFVTVPDPVLGPRALGTDGSPPRAVPLDAVTALLAPLVPSGVQQQVMLAASLLLAGVGVSVLLRRHGVAATVVAAALTTWSPYAGERLLLGQPPTLLAWSVLPWLVLAVRRPGPRLTWLGLVLLAALPALLTPFGCVTTILAALLLATAGSPQRRPPRDLMALVGLGVTWCLPWLVPALTSGLGASTTSAPASGAQAFSVRADGPAGVVDLAGGGGIWADGATLASRGTGIALVASAVVLALGGLGLSRGTAWTGASGQRARVLAGGALAGPPLLALGLSNGPGLDWFGAAQAVPGVALIRDTHRLLGVSALAGALLAGLGVAVLVRSLPAPAAAYRAKALGLVLCAVALAPLTSPDLLGRLHAAYRPVSFPAGWVDALTRTGPGATLVLPWQPLRVQDWAGEAPFLDPLALAVRGRVVAAHLLVVDRAGQSLTVGEPEPAAAAQWAAGRLDPAVLRALGIGSVWEWRTTPGAIPSEHPGLVLVHEDEAVRVWRVA
jgi:hypothetical protein